MPDSLQRTLRGAAATSPSVGEILADPERFTNAAYESGPRTIPRLTVAVPTYKRPWLLRETLQTVVTQASEFPWELLVLDNAASEEVIAVAKEIAAGTTVRLCVFQNRWNLGMWGNVNLGVALAQGEWLLLLPDDDLLRPNALRAFHQWLAHAEEAVLCIAGGVELVYEDRLPTISPIHAVNFPVEERFLSHDALVVWSPEFSIRDVPKLCATLFRPEAIVTAGGFDEQFAYYADLALILELHSRRGVYLVPEVFGQYRVHSANASSPGALWEGYPPAAAGRIARKYLSGTSPFERSERRALQSFYLYLLATQSMPYAARAQRCQEVLDSIDVPALWRLLLRRPWLLAAARFAYASLRLAARQILKPSGG